MMSQRFSTTPAGAGSLVAEVIVHQHTSGRGYDIISWQVGHIVWVQQRCVAQIVRPEQGGIPAGACSSASGWVMQDARS